MARFTPLTSKVAFSGARLNSLTSLHESCQGLSDHVKWVSKVQVTVSSQT